jgi:hypothetical protein
MGKRWERHAVFVAIFLVAGCESATSVRSGDSAHRLLTDTEMDQISVGAAAAFGGAGATALGPSPVTTATTDTLTSSGEPVSAKPFANLATSDYASSQTHALAANAPYSSANGSAQIAVSHASNSAAINASSVATAVGSGAGQAQIDLQFYGLSVGRVDLAFGSASATACCAASLAAQSAATAHGTGNWRQLKAAPLTDTPGQAQSRMDISIVSSTLPILDAGHVSALLAPTLSQSAGQ